MDNIIVGIHQPNFMPWLGYFYKIGQSDIFIFLDDVQFQKTGSNYTNRVCINAGGKSKYLTIAIKRPSGVFNINEAKFANEKWKKQVIGTLQANYAKAKFFRENKEFIFELINYKVNNLAEYNINFIIEVSKKLNLKTKFIKSSSFNIKTTSTQRLIDLIKKVGGNIYLSGKGGDKYQDKKMFEKSNIKLIYNEIPKYEYLQYKTDNFIPGLSIIDAIFNIGFEQLKKDLFN